MKINIAASSIDEWNSIHEKLSTLPQIISNQFEKVENGIMGYVCYIKKLYQDNPKLYLPTTVTQIQEFDDYIGIYCDGFFIKAPKETFHYTYLFIKTWKQHPWNQITITRHAKGD